MTGEEQRALLDEVYRRLAARRRRPVVITFALALWRHVRDWCRRVSSTEHARRLELCLACPEWRVKRGRGRCQLCGCAVHAKARWSSESCPIGRW
jgi:hypothetical protein